MIRLNSLTIAAGGDGAALRDVTCSIQTSRHFVLYAENERERRSFMASLAGTIIPESGEIVRHVSLSYPLGHTTAFRKDLTVEESIRHAAISFGADAESVFDYAASFPGLDIGWDNSFGLLPQALQAKVSFAVCFGIPFDCYLIDGAMSIGDETFRAACAAAFQTRCDRGYIFATRHVSYAETYGDCGAILSNGELKLYESISALVRDARLTKAAAATAKMPVASQTR